jgi:hypothetical protein
MAEKIIAVVIVQNMIATFVELNQGFSSNPGNAWNAGREVSLCELLSEDDEVGRAPIPVVGSEGGDSPPPP